MSSIAGWEMDGKRLRGKKQLEAQLNATAGKLTQRSKNLAF
jgi:hypothetical protein